MTGSALLDAARSIADASDARTTATPEDLPPGAIAPVPRDHLRYLDGLRGLAILAVLMIHTGQLVPGLPQPLSDVTFYGVRGVQLFFIVSGLTLTMNHLDRPLRIVDFARRRFLRVAPMFYLGAALYLALAATTTMPLPTRAATPLDIVATLLFVHGWVPSAINTVVPGGWSIAAEAMFYVAFPAILLVARRGPRALAVAAAASYVIAGLTNVALRHWFGPTSEIAFSFWLVQLPAFVSGCWLATLRTRPQLRPVARAAMLLGAVGLVVDSQLRGHSNLLVAIALLAAFTWAAGVTRPRWLEGRVMPLLGQISFSLYILQFAVLGALRPAVPAVVAAIGPEMALMVVFLAALGVTGALAIVTYRRVEKPAIALARRLGAPSRRP